MKKISLFLLFPFLLCFNGNTFCQTYWGATITPTYTSGNVGLGISSTPTDSRLYIYNDGSYYPPGPGGAVLPVPEIKLSRYFTPTIALTPPNIFEVWYQYHNTVGSSPPLTLIDVINPIGYLGINQPTPSQPLDVNGNALIESNLTVNSNATVGSLNVGTTSTVAGAETVGGTFGVTGATTLHSTLGVTGTVNFTNTGATALTVAGTTTINGNTNITKPVNFTYTGASAFNVSGPVTITNTGATALRIAGTTTITAPLNVTGLTTLFNTEINGLDRANSLLVETNEEVDGNEFIFGGIAVNGTALIGTSSFPTGLPGGYSLYVAKGILTEKLKVANSSDTSNWSDFVFNSDYKLKTLSVVEEYVKANKHLPEIPSAKEVAKDGIDVVDMDAKFLQKIEELTLYIIQQQKDIAQQQKEIDELKKLIKK